MLDNEKAIKLTGEERVKEIESRLADYLDNDLLNLFREANSYDGYFDFVDAFDIEDLCSMVSDKYELVRSIIYGNVDNVNDMVRYNAYGNLESVSEWDLIKECQDNLREMAEWLMDDYNEVYSLYEDDKELFETWWKIDHDQYDWEEDEDE